ncbi:Shedu anti-phage system protein SduA domain-containing protein [Sphaerimonospora sp. CA-214678]|uniref:Shedu anti-phage system protein SduA domain-containing protein n=1 Tax=Sphaerimonospora sp. CA-214678 TaxID=3240029 RepID=UPI003D8C9C36
MVIGDLPGWPAAVESASRSTEADVYAQALSDEWRRLVSGDAFHVEKVAQGFLERHPSLIPGSSGPTMRTGWTPWPAAVIRQPVLPGLAERQPDFMWIATDSAYLMPICIEIERPDKKWFRDDGNVQHSDLTSARSQVAAWRSWFMDPHNAAQFVHMYRVPRVMAERLLRPHFIVIHGRRSEFDSNPRVRRLRAGLTANLSDEVLMTFDALGPDSNALRYGTVELTRDGVLRAVAAPATFDFPVVNPEFISNVDGWDMAIRASLDISGVRKRELLDILEAMQSRPSGMRFSVARRRTE